MFCPLPGLIPQTCLEDGQHQDQHGLVHKEVWGEGPPQGGALSDTEHVNFTYSICKSPGVHYHIKSAQYNSANIPCQIRQGNTLVIKYWPVCLLQWSTFLKYKASIIALLEWQVQNSNTNTWLNSAVRAKGCVTYVRKDDSIHSGTVLGIGHPGERLISLQKCVRRGEIE